jgi:hypothetical protein
MYFRDAYFIFVATILDEEMEARGWTGPYDILSQALRYQDHDYPSGVLDEKYRSRDGGYVDRSRYSKIEAAAEQTPSRLN